MPDTNEPFDPDQDAEPDQYAEPLANMWDPTEPEVAALDTLMIALGSNRMPGKWFAGATDTGDRWITLHLSLPFYSFDDCIGQLEERDGGGWATFDQSGGEPEAEADTIPALAEALGDLWGGPGRWKLAAEEVAKPAS